MPVRVADCIEDLNKKKEKEAKEKKTEAGEAAPKALGDKKKMLKYGAIVLGTVGSGIIIWRVVGNGRKPALATPASTPDYAQGVSI